MLYCVAIVMVMVNFQMEPLESYLDIKNVIRSATYARVQKTVWDVKIAVQ